MTDQPHNSDSDAGEEWGTPPWIVEPLADAIGGFDLDPASGAEPKPYADERYTKEDNGLTTEWFGHVWVNPPYGRKQNPRWAKRAYKQRKNCESITALVPASTSESWWQQYYSEFEVFCFIDGRVKFIGAGDDGASFGNVICVDGAEALPDEYFVELHRHGTVLSHMDRDDRSIFEL